MEVDPWMIDTGNSVIADYIGNGSKGENQPHSLFILIDNFSAPK